MIRRESTRQYRSGIFDEALRKRFVSTVVPDLEHEIRGSSVETGWKYEQYRGGTFDKALRKRFVGTAVPDLDHGVQESRCGAQTPQMTWSSLPDHMSSSVIIPKCDGPKGDNLKQDDPKCDNLKWDHAEYDDLG